MAWLCPGHKAQLMAPKPLHPNAIAFMLITGKNAGTRLIRGSKVWQHQPGVSWVPPIVSRIL